MGESAPPPRGAKEGLLQDVKGRRADGSTTYGAGWSHKYLNKKEWHPKNYENQKRLWLAQQRANEEEKRKASLQAELESERAFERQMEAKYAAAGDGESGWRRAGGAPATTSGNAEADASGGRTRKRRRTAEQERMEKEKNLRALRFMYERPPGVAAAANGEEGPARGGGAPAEAERGEEKQVKATDIYGRKVATGAVHEELKHAPREAGLGEGVVMRHNALGAAFHAGGGKWSAKDKAWYERELPTEQTLREQELAERRRERPESTVGEMLHAREALTASGSRLQLKAKHSEWRIGPGGGGGGGGAVGSDDDGDGATREKNLHAQLLELGATESDLAMLSKKDMKKLMKAYEKTQRRDERRRLKQRAKDAAAFLSNARAEARSKGAV